MKREQIQITLGGQQALVRALTFDQLPEALEHVAPITWTPGNYKTSLDHAVAAISIASGLSREEIVTFRPTIDEIVAAVTAVAEVSGLKQLGEDLAAKRAASSIGSTSLPA